MPITYINHTLVAKFVSLSYTFFFIFALSASCGGGLINVCESGAVSDGRTDDYDVLQSIMAKQLATSVSEGLYFPPGKYLFSRTLRLTRPIHFSGAGFDPVGGTLLIFDGSNAPAVEIDSRAVVIENIAIRYASYQKSDANPCSACLQFDAGSYLNIVRNVSLQNGAFGIYNPPRATSWQNRLDTIWILGYSRSGVDVETGGSTWTWNNIYVQNCLGHVSSHFPVLHYNYDEGWLTLRVDRRAVLQAFPGLFVILSGMTDARLNGAYALQQVVSGAAQETLLVQAKKLDNVQSGTGQIDFQEQPEVGGYPLIVCGDHDFTGLDVEHARTRQDAFIRFLGGGCINVSHLHLEALYSVRTCYAFIRSEAPAMRIETLTAMNLGFKPNDQVALIRNLRGRVASIGNLHVRDIMHNGAGWMIQRPALGDGAASVNQVSVSGTVREGCHPVFDEPGMAKVVCP